MPAETASKRRRAAGRGAEPDAGPLALFGWVLFDWATQPFYTLVVTFLFAPYFVNGFMAIRRSARRSGPMPPAAAS